MDCLGYVDAFVKVLVGQNDLLACREDTLRAANFKTAHYHNLVDLYLFEVLSCRSLIFDLCLLGNNDLRSGSGSRGILTVAGLDRDHGGRPFTASGKMRLVGAPHRRIRRIQGCVTAMYSRGVLVHCLCRLSAAVSVLAAEIPSGDGVFTERAREH
jgi:hypothetical protein